MLPPVLIPKNDDGPRPCSVCDEEAHLMFICPGCKKRFCGDHWKDHYGEYFNEATKAWSCEE